MIALLPGTKIAGALPVGKMGGAIVSGGAKALSKKSFSKKTTDPKTNIFSKGDLIWLPSPIHKDEKGAQRNFMQNPLVITPRSIF